MSVYVVIPAAGLGTRMGDATNGRNKVLLPLSSTHTVLEQTIANCAAARDIDGIVVAARADELDAVGASLLRLAGALDCEVVEGGETRQESVFRGLSSLRGKCEVVLVHDGARPLCSSDEITAVVGAARRSGAAILAERATATLKRATDSGTIRETLPRDDIWLAQTPQGFSYELLMRAHQDAQKDNFVGTDESSLVERLGVPVELVAGTRANIKITTPEDIEFARRIVGAETRE